ncbi:flippase activity-associated protein Agl23 [Chloroflexus sp.]|uniref:flippase activity-associated protein Agl23 n=1 Tax=Chloroflexus sp. TaxID=1904827 RepID=UPI00260E06FB|nr:flippase activity-associated protein Agl23 [uncultured Chloroflexus sp.]
MSTQTLTTETLLDRRLRIGWLTWETALYTIILIASVIAHLWGLERMALHHDESIHAWSSWRLYSGAGGFSCWNGLDENGNARGGVVHETYCYDPVYHGPSLYFLTALIYFLFGDGDAQARLPMALAGIGLVASAWWLRPYLGRAGALVAAFLLGFSPSLLYYTRFARHDGLMVLWELWMVIGALRWIDTGRRQWLYLTALGLTLAIATHELYYILLFIFGIFVLMRLLAESRFARYLNIALLVVIGLCAALMIINPPLPFGRGLYIGEKAFLVASALALAWLCQRLWPPEPILTERLRQLWREERATLWTALAILGGVYLVLYTSFFTYLPGAIDGITAGLIYWLGSQQDYARGDQPWYYYLMLLPLYEPLAVLSGIGVVGAMIVAVARRWLATRRVANAATAEPVDDGDVDTTARLRAQKPWPLYPLLVVFWFFTAIIIFSWAGEKMPWLVVHMALPGNLLAAWVIGRIIDVVRRERVSARIWLIPLIVILLSVAVGVAFWRLSSGEQSALLQAIIPLLIVFGLIYALLTLLGQLGGRATLAAVSLTVALALAAYTIRASWLVVYDHPDVPIEPLIYTQTAPDVPRYAADIRELAINLTRSNRGPQDPVGGLTMPVVLDRGDETSEGSLAWPLNWYLRDFQNLVWVNGSELGRVPSVEQLTVTMPDGNRDLAPMVLLYRPYVTDRLRDLLRESYVQPYGKAGVFNWWFPEGNKCSPQSPGYKRFYYSTWSAAAAQEDCGRDLSSELNGPFDALLWPFRRENWPALGRYLLFRQLPEPLTPGAREVEVWLRRDLAGGVAQTATSVVTAPELRLAAQAEIRLSSAGIGATGIAIDPQGNIYMADTLNHRIEVFAPDGALARNFGSQGSGLDQFYEPRGLAFDAEGNLYVADTWNARIVKYSPELRPLASWGSGDLDLGDGRRATITEGDPARNAAAPLGFFGPRGVAVDADGNVYIADTGNKRIVVTDSNGTFLYQFGGAGSAPGQFNEPTSLAFDGAGNLYVADTWNGRVQVFARAADGRIDPIPLMTWPVRGWQSNTYDDPMLTVSRDGTVYVAVPSRQHVLVVGSGGDPLLRWTGVGMDNVPISSPSGLAVASDGSIWVVDRIGGRAVRFSLPALAPVRP